MRAGTMSEADSGGREMNARPAVKFVGQNIRRDLPAQRTMNYSIWAILTRYLVPIMCRLGGSVARCAPFTAFSRRGPKHVSAPGRTTLRPVAVVQSVFDAFGLVRSNFVPTGSSLILPDISARVSERIFFPSAAPPNPVRACYLAASACMHNRRVLCGVRS